MLVLLAAVVMAQTPAVLTLGEATAPPGVWTGWTVEGCNLKVQIRNSGADPLEVDWTRSTWTAEGAPSVTLIPGWASRLTSQMVLPPTVVPPGQAAEEVLFRRDHMDGDACLFTPPVKVAVILATTRGPMTQRMGLAVDQAEVDRRAAAAAALLEAQRKASEEAEYKRKMEAAMVQAEQARRACITRRDDLHHRARPRRVWGYIFGFSSAGMGVAGIASAADTSETDGERVAGAVGGGLLMVAAAVPAILLHNSANDFHARANGLGC